MDILYAGGVNNPMDSIEQISYLLFIKLLWEKDQDWKIIDSNHQGLFTGEWERYEWGRISNLTGDELFNTLRDVIEKLEELPALTDTGRLLFRQSTLKILDRPTLRAVVQGVNMVKRHTAPSQAGAGGIVEKEASIHVSNLAHIDPKDNNAVRVGFKTLKGGRKVRYAKRSGEVIDI